ncbi:protein kinase [bacterium]|nr:protein kinase [bacterium]
MSSPDPLLGRRLGHVLIRRLVGRGGMGAVYEGYQENLDRRVAVKVIAPERLDDPHMLGRFRREALSVARLSHPNIVRIYDALDEGDLHCLVMEYLDGENLKEMVRRGPLEIEQAVAYGIDVAEGLWHAHSQDPPIIHRDIKSENIIITPEGAARITDFGAVLLPDTGMKTRTGMVVGTPEYMSPEQIRGLPLDFRSDLYSLGVVLFEMLVGELPFSSRERFEIARRQVQELPVSPRALRPDVPEDLATVVLKALEKDRGQRYQSAADLLADLRLIEVGERIKTRISYKPSTPSERHTVQTPRASETTATLVGPDTRTLEIDRELILRRRRRRLALPFALVLLAALAMGAFLLQQSLRTDKTPPVSIADLAAAPGLDPGQVELTWTAPFEDYDGRAARYEIRAADHPFDLRTLHEARDLSSFAPTPERAGANQRAVLRGLSEGQRYYFAVLSHDRAGNRSGLSNPARSLPRGIPPGPARDFSVRYENGAVQLSWRAAGDDGEAGGPAARHIVLMHSEPITEMNWTSALDKTPADLASASPGELMRATLADVAPGQYFFGVRALDDVGELGPIASSLRVEVGPLRDAIPPAAVLDLSARPGSAAGSVSLAWTAPGDDGTEGRAWSYLVKLATAPILSDGDWEEAAAVARVIAPVQAGGRQEMLAPDLSEGVLYHFALRAVDEAGNVAALGNSPCSRATAIPPAPITDLRADAVVKAGACEITLRWTAPGDDGMDGRAERYQLRESNRPIGEADWDEARALRETPPAPAPAGREESMTFIRRETGRVYYAVRAIDDAGNAAPVSNSAVCDLSDTIPPDKVGRFTARAAGDDAVVLSRLATGDDGVRGRATRYEAYWDQRPLTEGNWRRGRRVTRAC